MSFVNDDAYNTSLVCMYVYTYLCASRVSFNSMCIYDPHRVTNIIHKIIGHNLGSPEESLVVFPHFVHKYVYIYIYAYIYIYI